MTNRLSHVLVTRPQADGERTVRRATELGLRPTLLPLMEVVPLAIDPAHIMGAQAIICTSANAVRALSLDVCPDRQVLVYAVGPATAGALTRSGFSNVRVGSGNVASLLKLIRAEIKPEAGSILHVAGRVHSDELTKALTSEQYTVRTVVAYSAEPSTEGANALSGYLTATPDREEAVLLYSPRSARLFADVVVAHDLAGSLALREAFCLSPAVRQPIINLPFRRTHISLEPNENALFSLLRDAL